MKRALALPFLLLGLLVNAAGADAQSFHEDVAPPALMKKGARFVGLRFKLSLRPESGSTQTKVRVGLGPMTPKPAGADYDWHRPLASDASKGYLVHQFPEITIDPKADKNGKAVELEVLFADAPGLKKMLEAATGDIELEVISAWNDPSNPTYWHVWGIQSVYKDPKSVIKLKPLKPAAKEAAAADPKEAKPATRKPRATAAKPRRTVQQRRTAMRRTALKARGRLRGR